MCWACVTGAAIAKATSRQMAATAFMVWVFISGPFGEELKFGNIQVFEFFVVGIVPHWLCFAYEVVRRKNLTFVLWGIDWLGIVSWRNNLVSLSYRSATLCFLASFLRAFTEAFSEKSTW